MTLEDLYGTAPLYEARKNGSLAEKIKTETRPDGQMLHEGIQWNKDRLANYFCDHATDGEWLAIEQFVLKVVKRLCDSTTAPADVRARTRPSLRANFLAKDFA